MKLYNLEFCREDRVTVRVLSTVEIQAEISGYCNGKDYAVEGNERLCQHFMNTGNSFKDSIEGHIDLIDFIDGEDDEAAPYRVMIDNGLFWLTRAALTSVHVGTDTQLANIGGF